MMMRLEQTYKASFYGYCNGDLLFHSSLLGALRVVRDKIRANELRTHVGSSKLSHSQTFLVGRRTNIFQPFPVMSLNDRATNDALIERDGAKGELFQSDAEDYFLFTKGTLPWDQLVNTVIGRPGYDNYLVTKMFKMNKEVSFLDITNAVLVAHQTDASGTKAGHRPSPDHDWNMKLIKREWQKGRTEYSWWIVEQYPSDTFVIQERYAAVDIPWDDRYSQQEWKYIQPHIPPNATCLEFGRAAAHGYWKSVCKELTVVFHDRRLYM